MIDPIVEEVRRIRREPEARFGFSIQRIVADIREQERLSGSTFVTLSPKPPRSRGCMTPVAAAVVRETGEEGPYKA